MTKKEFDALMKIMGDSCHGYEIAMKKLSQDEDYKKFDSIQKHKAYLSEIVHIDLKWRDEVMGVLWNSKPGKILAKKQDDELNRMSKDSKVLSTIFE